LCAKLEKAAINEASPLEATVVLEAHNAPAFKISAQEGG